MPYEVLLSWCLLCKEWHVSKIDGVDKSRDHFDSALHVKKFNDFMMASIEPKKTNCEICGEQYTDSFDGWISHGSSLGHRNMVYINKINEIEKKLEAELKRAKYPAYDSVKTCPKCNHKFVLASPTSRYLHHNNLMTRGCHVCGATWKELCADGSEPINVE